MGVLWLPVNLVWAPVPCEVLLTGKHEGDPVIGYDFSAMSDEELMRVERREGCAAGLTGSKERSRIAGLADAELSRRGVHERYT